MSSLVQEGRRFESRYVGVICKQTFLIINNKSLFVQVDTGLDRSLNALVGWVRTILSTDQKKSDFNPPMSTGPNKHAGLGLAQASPACLRVVKFVNHQVSLHFKTNLTFDDSRRITFYSLFHSTLGYHYPKVHGRLRRLKSSNVTQQLL